MELSKKRIILVFMLLTVIFIVLLGRAVFLQIFPDERVIKMAKKQYSGEVALSPRRGDIYDRNGNPLAVSLDFDSLYVDPLLVIDKKTAAQIIAKELGLDEKEILNKISNNNKRFVWIKHMLSPEESKSLAGLIKKERGVRTIKEPKRVYPNGTLASHVVGFVDREAKGVDGIERFYDEYIKSTDSKIKYQKDGKKRLIYSDGNMFLSSDSGSTVYLTIDNNLQYLVEKELKETVDNKNAASGTVIIMNHKNGEILALANYPSYNPNEPGKHNAFELKNRAITDIFEPGSIFKIITAGIALKNKIIDLSTEIWGENGRYTIVAGKRPVVVKEAKGHDYGMMNITKLIAKSSNVGSAKLGIMIGEKIFFEGVDSFGFGERTNVDLPGEVRGIVNKKGGKVTLANAAFGQGISVTAMQIVKAYSIIANGGYDVVPHLVKNIVDERGYEVQSTFNQKGDEIIPTHLAKELAKMLRAVVEEGGTATGTDITGFEIAGKTGTAQKPEHGRYSLDKYLVSFAGFFPASDPQYTMLVLIDEPKGAYFASVVAVPLFKMLANNIIHNQSVMPKMMPKEEKITVTTKKEDGTSVNHPVQVKVDIKPHDPKLVPDLRGLSLRQALGVISNNWDDVNTYGSGKVVSQTPAPGNRNPDDKVISIWLE